MTGCSSPQGRVLHETPDWNGSFSADNVGWRDQRYSGSYERIGFLKINGLFDEIPQFYSVDTRTAFVETGDGVLELDDNAQRAANLNVYPPISPQFDLRESRKIGTFRVSATPTTHLDVTGGFTTTKHSGELPWGASFGFSNDNEVALPYRSRTNDMDVGLEWTNTRAMFRAAYNGSWFNNQADPLTLGQPAGADGFDVRLRAWPDGPVAVQLVADAQRGWLREVRASDAAHRLARLWLGEQRRAAPAIHDQQCAAAVRAAARDGRRVGDHRCHEHQPGVAPGQPLAFQHAVPPLRLQQQHARDRRFPSSSTTTRRSRTARRAGRSCSRTTAIRSMPMPRGPASLRRPSRSRTRTTTTGTTIASSSRPTRTYCSSRQTRPVSGG